MNIQKVIVKAKKFDGSLNRSWECDFVSQTDSLIALKGTFSEEVNHPEIGVIRRATVSYEFFWFESWFNIFRFHEPGGELKCFYCNISSPPTFSGRVLEYIDLDLDLIVDKNYDYRILDLEEFEQNSVKLDYSTELIRETENALQQLVEMIKNREFPFDFQSAR